MTSKEKILNYSNVIKMLQHANFRQEKTPKCKNRFVSYFGLHFLQYNPSAHEPLDAINAHILSPVID